MDVRGCQDPGSSCGLAWLARTPYPGYELPSGPWVMDELIIWGSGQSGEVSGCERQ